MPKATKGKCLAEVISNASDDRKATLHLLDDVVSSIMQSSDKELTHKNVGLIAGKYLEILQKINEQILKAASMIDKKNGDKDEEDIAIDPISKKDIDSFYEDMEKGN